MAIKIGQIRLKNLSWYSLLVSKISLKFGILIFKLIDFVLCLSDEFLIYQFYYFLTLTLKDFFRFFFISTYEEFLFENTVDG